MALEYDLFLDDEFDESSIAKAVNLAFQQEPKSSEKEILVIEGTGVTPYMAEAILDQFGFAPKSGWTITLNKFAEPNLTSTKLLQSVFAVIQDERISNAVLLFSGEIPILQYQGNALLLNESRGYWDQRKIDLLPISFQMKKMQVL